MTIERILVVDDDPLMRQFLQELLKRLGKEVTLASDGEQAIEELKKESFDLILTDWKMPCKNGLEVVQAAKKFHPSSFVILMSAFGSIDSAVEAIKYGAFHYLIKPFPPEALESLLKQCEAQTQLIKENRYLREHTHPTQLVANSKAMQSIVQDLEKIAKSQASVFITGESGTGKEVLAAEIHRLSARSSHPFIKVNCAAIPETLAESEFFGHEKGAFTGAFAKKTGRFELAHLGTLLLDEVTEIPLALQSKLLRAIQEQEFERVGGSRSIKVNVRFLAASNRNMQEAIQNKIFREDLFYRLNVVPIHLPPLREREEDILPLARHFLERFCLENHKPPKVLSKGAQELLLNYRWPGNVRELANILERTVVLDFGPEIQEEHLHLTTTPLQEKYKPSQINTLEGVEKRLILETMETARQNRTKAAALLGISVKTLRNKLKLYAQNGLI